MDYKNSTAFQAFDKMVHALDYATICELREAQRAARKMAVDFSVSERRRLIWRQIDRMLTYVIGGRR